MIKTFNPSKLKKFVVPYYPSPKASELFKHCVVDLKDVWDCKYVVRGMQRGDLLYLYTETANKIFIRVVWMARKVEPSKDFETTLMETMVYGEVRKNIWKSSYVASVTEEDVVNVITINYLLHDKRNEISKDFCNMVILGITTSKSIDEFKNVIKHVKGSYTIPYKPWGLFYNLTDEDVLKEVPTDMVLSVLDSGHYKSGKDIQERLKILSSTLRTVVVWLDCNGYIDRSTTINEAEGIMCLYTNYVYSSENESNVKYEEAIKHIQNCNPGSVLFTLLCLIQSTDIIVTMRAEILYPLYACIRELVCRTKINRDGMLNGRSVYNRFGALMTGKELDYNPVPRCIADSKEKGLVDFSVTESKSIAANNLIVVVFDAIVYRTGSIIGKQRINVYKYVNEHVMPIVHNLPDGFHITLFNIVDNHIMNDVHMKKK